MVSEHSPLVLEGCQCGVSGHCSRCRAGCFHLGQIFCNGVLVRKQAHGWRGLMPRRAFYLETRGGEGAGSVPGLSGAGR